MATIDSTAIYRLVDAALATGLGSAVSYVSGNQAEPTPWAGGTLVRLVRVDVVPVERVKGSGTDLATVSVAINVTVAPLVAAANVYAARSKAAVVAAILDEARLTESGVSGVTSGEEHTLQLERCEVRSEPADEQRAMGLASVMAMGLAQRAVGTSRL